MHVDQKIDYIIPENEQKYKIMSHQIKLKNEKNRESLFIVVSAML